MGTPPNGPMASPAARRISSARGALQSRFAGHGDERCDLRFELFDAVEKRGSDFAAREFFGLNVSRQLRGGKIGNHFR